MECGIVGCDKVDVVMLRLQIGRVKLDRETPFAVMLVIDK